MIEIKPKPCSGTGVAKGFGCGKITKHRVYGLCKMGCYPNWLFSSEPGKIKLSKALNIAKSKTKKEQTQKTNAQKENLKTKSDLEKDLQTEINTIIRLIDKGFVCISTRNQLNAKYDAGHFFSRGSSPTIKFNLFNIYAQSVYANQHLSGDQINFMMGLRHYYGNKLTEYVLELKSLYKLINLSREDLKSKTLIARKIVKELKNTDAIYNVVERIEMRKKYNIEIGIYLDNDF